MVADDKRTPSRRKAAWAAYMRRYRANESPEQRERRLKQAREAYHRLTPEQRERRRQIQRERARMRRREIKKG